MLEPWPPSRRRLALPRPRVELLGCDDRLRADLARRGYGTLRTVTVLLAGRGVSRRYGGREVLAPCDVELRAGEVVALVGPNGSGKSTLLSVLAGALDPSAGRVERHAAVGWAPQRPAVYGRLTPRENVTLFARLDGHPADAVLDLPETPTATHSVGMRQRLNLALAFLGDPPVLLLDEPTASLDPERRAELWARLDGVRAAGGAVCFATQNVDELTHAGRVLELHEGRLRT
jgi:ABC-type multidrug transport system ATPase subunit